MLTRIFFNTFASMNQLKAGAVLSYIILGLNTIVGLLYTPYMLRMLGQSEYGLYSLVASVIAYLTVLDLGFGNAIVRYTAKFRVEGKKEEQYTMFGMFVVLYILIGVVAFALGLFASVHVDTLFGSHMTVEEVEKARIMLMLLSFNLAVTFPFSLFGSIITAYEDFVFQKVVQIARIVLSTIMMIVLLKIGYKAIALVVVTTAFNLLTLVINYLYCKKKIGIRLIFGRPDWSFLKEVSVYSFYILLNAIMDRIYWSTGQFILGIVSGTVAVAIYSVAITLQQMYMLFSTAISGVFLPKVTSMVATKQSTKAVSDLFIRTGRIQYMVMSFILVGFMLFGNSFIRLWAGENYVDAYVITLLFFIPLTVPLIQNMGVTILQARNQMRFRSILYIFIALGSLFLSFFGAKRYGAIGCAIGTSVALCMGQILVMNIYYYKRQSINIPAFWKEILKMSGVPLLFLVVGFKVLVFLSIHTVGNLLLSIIVFSLLYLPFFWRFSMNTYEKELISGMLWSIKKRMQR